MRKAVIFFSVDPQNGCVPAQVGVVCLNLDSYLDMWEQQSVLWFMKTILLTNPLKRSFCSLPVEKKWCNINWSFISYLVNNREMHHAFDTWRCRLQRRRLLVTVKNIIMKVFNFLAVSRVTDDAGKLIRTCCKNSVLHNWITLLLLFCFFPKLSHAISSLIQRDHSQEPCVPTRWQAARLQQRREPEDGGGVAGGSQKHSDQNKELFSRKEMDPARPSQPLHVEPRSLKIRLPPHSSFKVSVPVRYPLLLYTSTLLCWSAVTNKKLCRKCVTLFV